MQHATWPELPNYYERCVAMSATIVTQQFWIAIFLGLKMSLAGQQFHSNNNVAAG
jgi:hypothetical protein